MKLYDLLLLLQLQIHSKCEWAEKNKEIVAKEIAQKEQQTNAANAAAAAAAAGGETAGVEGNVSSQLTPTAPHRKMSGSSTSLDVSKASSSSSSSSAPSEKKPAASTEFEYVYEWEDGDEEIVGKNSNFNLRRSPQARFGTGYLLCHKETLFLMKSRWDSLITSFYDPENDTFDPTKLPDVYDCIKYDVLHNMEFLADIRPLYSAIKRVADLSAHTHSLHSADVWRVLLAHCYAAAHVRMHVAACVCVCLPPLSVVPNEYGILRKDKWLIGVGIARPLLKRMIGKLESALSPRCPSRVTLYFSSESHIHALRNVLLLSGIACNRTVATTLDAIELNYLSHAVFRLYEDVSKPIDDPLRYYVNVQFSPGAALGH